MRKDKRREEERGGAHGQDAGVAIDAGEQKRPDRVLRPQAYPNRDVNEYLLKLW